MVKVNVARVLELQARLRVLAEVVEIRQVPEREGDVGVAPHRVRHRRR
jgi:hypothetical protein